MRRRFRVPLAAAGFFALLGACAQPEGARFEPSPAVAAASPPLLQETARLRQALAVAEPDAERLAAAGDALTARAEALRARAADLNAPVIAPGRRDRLVGAGGARLPAQP